MRYLELKTLFFYRVLSWLLHSPAKQECNEILAFFFLFRSWESYAYGVRMRHSAGSEFYAVRSTEVGHKKKSEKVDEIMRELK